MEIIIEAYCKRCNKQTRQELGTRVVSTGINKYAYFCLCCNRWAVNASGYIDWLQLSPCLDPEELQVFQVCEANRCVVCGTRGADLHHWAPKEIFGEETFDKWPKDYLCRRCHVEWHNKMR